MRRFGEMVAVLSAVVLIASCSEDSGRRGSADDGTGTATDGQGTGAATADSGTAVGTDGTAAGTDGTATGTGGTDTGAGDTGAGTDGAATGDTGFVPCEPACEAPLKCVEGTCQEAVICQAGTWICEGLVSKKQCNDQGTAFLPAEECPGDQYCTSGQCGLKCSLDPKWGAYVGCVFWTVDLPVWDDPTLPNADTLPHAIVVSNPNELEATVQLTPPPGIPFTSTEFTVAGSDSAVFQFPSMDPSGSDIFDTGVKVESDRPVLVHQFNPLDNTFSNDASLLLPEPLLGQEHLVLSWPTDPRCLIEFPIPGLEDFGGPCAHSTVTVVAPFDDTEVTVRASARVAGSETEPMSVQPMPPGAIQTFVLHQGQVLNLDAMPETIFETADLTGTLVLSNKPVAVFSGHDSASVATPPQQGGFPGDEEEDNSCCLDHLEEQMLPVSLLGDHYVAAKSKSRGSDSDLWRIVAADDGVTITTSPSIAGLDGKTLAKRGDWIEAFSEDTFEINATGRVQVGQYLVSQADTDQGTGDPSLILAVPVERFRKTYPIMVPDTYSKDYVSVIRTPGTTIEVDGQAVAASQFTSVAGGQWELAWIELADGVHVINGDAPFGLSAYGYDNAASYGYPGGMTIPGEANP